MPRGRIRLFLWELESMDEYSTTLPSATTFFKMWKRDEHNAHFLQQVSYAIHQARYSDNAALEAKLLAKYNEMSSGPKWVVGMYAPHPNPERVRIYWYEVVLLEGPAPAVYHAPDWSNYPRWLREREAEREAEWRRQSPGFSSITKTARELRAERISG